MQAMTAILTETRCVSFPNCKKVWSTNKPCDWVQCDESMYIRVDPRSWTLMSVVCENNTNAPKPKPKSLNASRGLEDLHRLRNETQALLLNPPASAAGHALFDDAVQPKGKKARTSRSAIKAARHEAASLEVNISLNGQPHTVHMLRPVHPNDNIFALYSPDNMTAVIKYIRQEGFADRTSLSKSLRDPIVPQGIWSQDKAFVVVYRKDGGLKGFKRCCDLSSALAWQASNIAICTVQRPSDDLHEEPGAELLHQAASEEPSEAEGDMEPIVDAKP